MALCREALVLVLVLVAASLHRERPSIMHGPGTYTPRKPFGRRQKRKCFMHRADGYLSRLANLIVGANLGSRNRREGKCS